MPWFGDTLSPDQKCHSHMKQNAAQVEALLVQICSKRFNMSTLWQQASC